MTRRWLQALLPTLCAATSLFVGLAPTVLDYGRFEPLDWLLPGFMALIVMRFAGGAGMRRAAWQWALVVLPPALVLALSASMMPWASFAQLALLLGCGAAALATQWRWPWLIALVGLGVVAGVRLGAWRLSETVVSAPPVDRVAVMTSLPLFEAGWPDHDLLHGVGTRAPIIQGLDADWRTVPIEAFNAASLRGFTKLLVAQPRLLAPTELVALDDWVKAGGTVTILADPLLRWPSERPLGDPRRPPFTSLLDPLLTHWGLTLEPARVGPVERRVLAGGAMIQLAGASHFTLASGAPCSLAEHGLIAYCRIGKGRAVLVADADWIDDRLWTLAPERPRDQRAWTSDAIPMLSQLIAGDQAAVRPSGFWLSSQRALISALRWALALIVLLGFLGAWFVPNPMPSQVGKLDLPVPEKESGKPPPDSA